MSKFSYNPFTWLKILYHWCMSFGDHPKGLYFLMAFATVEAFIFPIPVDPLLIAMGAAKPKSALKFGAIALCCSLLGAFIGYFIGFELWEPLHNFFMQGSFQGYFTKATQMFQENTFMAMFLSGFTFLPFKVFTISAGVSHVELWPFFWGSLAGRGARFFLLAIPLYFFGEKIRIIMEKHFEKVTIAVFVIVVLSFYLLKH